MERFETLFEKNAMEKGSSFYIQSKIYFAKEFLMQDYPVELNMSQYNPDPNQKPEEDQEEQQEAKEEEKSDKKDKK